MKKGRGGYVAISRKDFDDDIFGGEFSRRDAWFYLQARAAWKPEAQRVHGGLVHCERGQLAVSIRGLGISWGWKVGKVQRYLASLKRANRITTGSPDTVPDTPTDTVRRVQATVITICKYEEFAGDATRTKSRTDTVPDTVPDTPSQNSFAFAGASTPEPSNHKTKEYKQEGSVDNFGEEGRRDAPKHGAQSVKYGTVYFHAGTPEWKAYAEDFEAVGSAQPIPDRYGGYWFFRLGEAARPAGRRFMKRRA